MMMAHDGRSYAGRWSEEFETGHGHSDGQSVHAGNRPGQGSLADEGSTTSSGTRDLGGIRGSASLRRLLRALLDGCIIGGVTLAPVMSILGFVGLLLPAESPWHHLAAGLLYGAVVWLCFSLAAAHLLRSELSGRDKCGATRQHGRRGDRPSAK